MANRSPAISLALLFAPTLCVVAIRFGLPALEEVISQDSVLEFSIHIAAISLLTTRQIHLMLARMRTTTVLGIAPVGVVSTNHTITSKNTSAWRRDFFNA